MSTRARRTAALAIAAIGGAVVSQLATSATAQQWATLAPPIQDAPPCIVQVAGADTYGIVHRVWSDGRIESADARWLGYGGPNAIPVFTGWRRLPN